MKVIVLGSKGMQGHVLARNLLEQKNIDVRQISRKELNIVPRRTNEICQILDCLCDKSSYVVNCIGAVKPIFNDCADLSIPFYTNAIFPHQLALWGSLKGSKIIHITSDCVFSGHKGSYVESDPHDALDEYGKTKSLGEPKNAMVLRTSIIGPELNGNRRSFFEWVMGQKSSPTNGFTNHYWNGLTTLELSHAISQIVADDMYEEGTHHVFSNDISKADMVEVISSIYDLGVRVNRIEAPQRVDRTLRTSAGLNDLLCPLDFEHMVKELKEWY